LEPGVDTGLRKGEPMCTPDWSGCILYSYNQMPSRNVHSCSSLCKYLV